MKIQTNGRLQFGEYELDLDEGRLLRGGGFVRIQPQPLRVLVLLAERAGGIVSREQLRTRIWGQATFVEFDQALNYCIRQIRVALRDSASEPRYIETLPKQGYRLIAQVVQIDAPAETEESAVSQPALDAVTPQTAFPAAPPTASKTHPVLNRWQIGAMCSVVALAGFAAFLSARATHPARVKYTQLTAFTDSALAPSLSPDGRVLAFIRGSSGFLTADQIYVKVLPDGEARRLTDDRRMKYGLAFTPDGSQVAYTVLDPPNWSVYTISILGGDSHFLMKNAAGLTWLNPQQVLFSQVWTGQHLGLVTAMPSRTNVREVYLPVPQRGMVHYNWPSPDRKSALVIEMDGKGAWAPCRMVSLEHQAQTRLIGPQGGCTSAGWSPDGAWMYFTATVQGESHLWRQRFPAGTPEQITFGPTEEEGLAVEQDGRSIITSVGAQQSAIWIHDEAGERPLSAEAEGEIVANITSPLFSGDGKVLYYLLRRGPAGSDPELWRTNVETGRSEAVFPGISMVAFDVSPDGTQVVYSAVTKEGKRQLWLTALNRRFAPARIGTTGELWPHFGARGQILFERAEGTFNYLQQMNPDGSGISKVVPYPVDNIQGISPGRRWVMAIVTAANGEPGPMAIPVDGGAPVRMCAAYCAPKWSSSGKYLFIPVEEPTRSSPGRSLAIPVGPNETLPALPARGIEPQTQADVVHGAQSVPRANLVPGRDPSHFAWVNTTVHRNLYRITLP